MNEKRCDRSKGQITCVWWGHVDGLIPYSSAKDSVDVRIPGIEACALR